MLGGDFSNQIRGRVLHDLERQLGSGCDVLVCGEVDRAEGWLRVVESRTFGRDCGHRDASSDHGDLHIGRITGDTYGLASAGNKTEEASKFCLELGGHHGAIGAGVECSSTEARSVLAA